MSYQWRKKSEERHVGMRIGLLEDNPAIVDMLVTALTLKGHVVESYTTGFSLLELLLPANSHATPRLYDVLIIDLCLPGDLSGWDVLARLEEVLSLEYCSVIVVSGASAGELERLHRRFPTVTVMHKPIHLAELLQIIANSTSSSQ